MHRHGRPKAGLQYMSIAAYVLRGPFRELVTGLTLGPSVSLS